jgi:prepilin-type N-terminal cleavage/methylation domain-containing protein
MERAFSLPELMLALAVAGILLALAIPPLSDTVDRIEVRGAAYRIAAAHQRARLMAVTRGHVLVLSVDQNQLAIRRRTDNLVLWNQPGPAESQVTLRGPGSRFTFSPEGLTLALSNATLRLSRGSATRAVVVSRLGRIRITD